MRSMKLLAGAALLSAVFAGPALASTYHYKLIDKIQLPAKPGHGDMLEYDPSNGYMYVSMTDGGAVVDTHTNKVVKSFPSIKDPNDNAFDDNYVYWTEAEDEGSTKANQIVVIDKKTWKIVARVNTQGTSPDGMQMDAANHKLYVMMDDNNWVEVYNTSGQTPKFESKIMLYPTSGSGPDVGTLAASKHTLYMPVDSWEEAIDTSTGKITQKTNTKVKVTKKGGTKGQVYDPSTDKLWVSTSTAKGGVLIFDPSTLKIVKRLPQKAGADQVAFDPKMNLMYVFEGAGKGFDVYNANTMKHITFVSTGVGSTHTGMVDPTTGNVYAYAGKASALYVYKPEK